jgi:antitoxin (DNA-binding transcriptional repressor) of toxin-antitoxin stability system
MMANLAIQIRSTAMQQVTVHVAKTTLSKLIEAALAGEEVVIARGDKPVVRLVAIPQGRFQVGLLKDQLAGPGPDFLSPMNEDELAAWEGLG